MMATPPTGRILGFSLLLVFLFSALTAPQPVRAGFLYKTYVVQKDRGTDILCDPYIVQKNDYVLKVFRQKGEISTTDFQEFLGIFKRINPHIPDINIIQTSQNIYIPLKKLEPNTFPGQDTGVITIPFVTLTKVSDLISSYSSEYQIQPGDTISVLIARQFGDYGSELYKEGVKLFKLNNPGIKNLNRIYAGQKIQLPDPKLVNEDWYESLFDSTGALRADIDPAPLSATASEPAAPSERVASGPQIPIPKPELQEKAGSAFEAAAAALDAKLTDSGMYYFPGPEGREIALDLGLNPLMEFSNGNRLIFPQENRLPEKDIAVIKTHWPQAKIAPLPAGASVEKVLEAAFQSLGSELLDNELAFGDNGIGVIVRARWILQEPAGAGMTPRRECITLIDSAAETTPDAISRYLEQNNIILREVFKGKELTRGNGRVLRYSIPDADRNAIEGSTPDDLLKSVTALLGLQYTEKTTISFPYGGIQIAATSNLISSEDGQKILVDYGELYGDAVSLIQKTGLDIIQIKADDGASSILRKVFTALKVPFAENPVFLAAKRPETYNVAITIPGFRVTRRDGDLLISAVPLHYEIAQFLIENGVKIVNLTYGPDPR
ncbi:MAG: LysM domain-containing protein [Desulfobacterales bacterium]